MKIPAYNYDLELTHGSSVAPRAANSLEDLSPAGGAISKRQKKPGLSMPLIDNVISPVISLPKTPKVHTAADLIQRMKRDLNTPPKPAPRNLKPKLGANLDSSTVTTFAPMASSSGNEFSIGCQLTDLILRKPRVDNTFQTDPPRPLTAFQQAAPAIVDALNLGASAPVLTTPERSMLDYFDQEGSDRTQPMNWSGNPDEEEALLLSDPEEEL